MDDCYLENIFNWGKKEKKKLDSVWFGKGLCFFLSSILVYNV